MRALVAGGAGFLGSHLCDYLLARGDEVVAVDDLTTGSPDNVAQHAQNPAFSLVFADVSKELPLEGRFDAVLNLA
ncbi:MAG: NAD-dependent epimerase/dehydratase family protein, partial [Actinomycetota bacterium]